MDDESADNNDDAVAWAMTKVLLTFMSGEQKINNTHYLLK